MNAPVGSVGEGIVVWQPSQEHLTQSNLAVLMRRLGVETYDAFLELTKARPDLFWSASLEHMGISFDVAPSGFVDLSRGKPWPTFFPGGKFNFARACLQAPSGGDGEQSPALICENEAGDILTYSYSELAERTKNFAAGLKGIGVREGDRIGVLLPNVSEAVVAFLAIGFIGAISVPLYSGFGPEPAAQRLRDSGACCLVSADGFIRRGKRVMLGETVKSIAERTPGLTHIVMADLIGELMPDLIHTRWTDIEGVGGASLRPAATRTSDPFMVMYTSGTTGKPKGTVHLHAGFPLRIVQDAAYLFDFRPGDRLMWMSDMGWMVGPLSIIAPLMLKGTLVLYDGAPDQPDAGRLRSIASRHGVTHFGSAPTAIRGMAARSAEALAAPFRSLRVLITAGEVIDSDAFDWYFTHFGGEGAPVINYTGGTEVSGAILTNVLMRPIARSRFNSIAPSMDVGIVDEKGNRIIDAPGELAIFQPFVGMTAGFWGDPDRYIESYWSRIPDIWVHGDLAMQCGDGQLQLLGRSDDVMKIAGKRVGPSEIESVVVDGKAIVEAFAVGVPDSTAGEALVLFIVAGAVAMDADLSVETHVARQLERSMGHPYRPAAVVRVLRLPKTRNGKPVRRLVRSAWLGQSPGNLAGIEDAVIFEELLAACAAYHSV